MTRLALHLDAHEHTRRTRASTSVPAPSEKLALAFLKQRDSLLRPDDAGGDPVRIGRDLIEATRPFVPESRLQSWLHVLSTTALLLLCLAVLGQPIFWPLRLALGCVARLLTVREFILYHDYMHGALLRG